MLVYVHPVTSIRALSGPVSAALDHAMAARLDAFVPSTLCHVSDTVVDGLSSGGGLIPVARRWRLGDHVAGLASGRADGSVSPDTVSTWDTKRKRAVLGQIDTHADSVGVDGFSVLMHLVGDPDHGIGMSALRSSLLNSRNLSRLAQDSSVTAYWDRRLYTWLLDPQRQAIALDILYYLAQNGPVEDVDYTTEAARILILSDDEALCSRAARFLNQLDYFVGHRDGLSRDDLFRLIRHSNSQVSAYARRVIVKPGLSLAKVSLRKTEAARVTDPYLLFLRKVQGFLARQRSYSRGLSPQMVAAFTICHERFDPANSPDLTVPERFEMWLASQSKLRG